MILIISSLVIMACLVAIVSGIWVIVGLVTELVNRSSTPDVSARDGNDFAHARQKSQDSSELV